MSHLDNNRLEWSYYQEFPRGDEDFIFSFFVGGLGDL